MSNHEYAFSTVIQKQHMDVFGHVNNAAFLALFEEARWDIINGNGYGIEKIKSTGFGPVVLEAHIKFLKELFLDEQITIKSQLVSYDGKIGKIHQEIFRDQELCSQADIVIGLIDLSKRKLVPPTSEWLKAVGLEGKE